MLLQKYYICLGIKIAFLLKNTDLFNSSISKNVSQGHRIQLVQAMCKYFWNDTSSLEPLPVKLDVYNTEESIRDRKK